MTQSVEVPHAVVWEPGNPILYLLETSTGGDTRSTRFGMREFHFDPATRQAMLNGKVCYLRGSSLTLHRFFGDPKCGGLPWDETWVRKFLVEIPHRMHWNAFRICIGPPPGRDITGWWPGPFGTASHGRPRSPGVRCGLRQRPPGFRLL